MTRFFVHINNKSKTEVFFFLVTKSVMGQGEMVGLRPMKKASGEDR